MPESISLYADDAAARVSAAGFTNNGTYMTQPLSNILGQVAFHFVPMLNPDGVTISQMGENGIQSEELRQTMQAAYAADKASSRTTGQPMKSI